MTTDARIFPRVDFEAPIEVHLAPDDVLRCSVTNVSQNGVMITACQQDFDRLLAKNNQLAFNKPVEVDLSFTLEQKESGQTGGETSGDSLIKTHARAVYVRRVAQDKYFVGFKFLRISQQDNATLKTFIEAHFANASV